MVVGGERTREGRGAGGDGEGQLEERDNLQPSQAKD